MYDVEVMKNNYTSSSTISLISSTPTTSFLNAPLAHTAPPPNLPLVSILEVARLMFPFASLDEDLALDVLRRAEESVNSCFTIHDAVKWADGFKYPSDVSVRDSLDLERLGGDLEALVRLRQSQIPHVRISKQRLIDLWDHSDPDFKLLLTIAGVGVPVLTDPDFVPNPEPPRRFSPTYTIAQDAVNKLNYEQFTAGLAVILPVTQVVGTCAPTVPLHFSRFGHALKSGKAKGRVTSNYTYGKQAPFTLEHR